MRKIFFNAFSYDDGGWFICEVRDYDYKNKTEKSIFVTKPHPTDPRGFLGVNDDPEVQAFLQEKVQVSKQLYDEMFKVATDLKLNFIPAFDKITTTDIILNNEDGKKLKDKLISMGWELEFLPIGP